MTSTDHDTDGNLVVTLLPWEFKWCVDVANQRLAISNEKSLNHASTYKRTHLERIEQEITGACAEMVVAKCLGKFWSPSVNTFHSTPDIEPNIEVRATTRTDGSLVVRDNDSDDRWYILVVGSPPTMTVVGCLRGSDAKQDQWLRNPHGHRAAWFVPQSALRKAAR
jgi:hypothetical protein